MWTLTPPLSRRPATFLAPSARGGVPASAPPQPASVATTAATASASASTDATDVGTPAVAPLTRDADAAGPTGPSPTPTRTPRPRPTASKAPPVVALVVPSPITAEAADVVDAADEGDATDADATGPDGRRWTRGLARSPWHAGLAGLAGGMVGAALATAVAVSVSSSATEPAPALTVPSPTLQNGSGYLGAWQQMAISYSALPIQRAAAADPSGVLLLGDSLARRVRPALFEAIAPAKRRVSWNTGNGRPTHGSVDAYIGMLAAGTSPRAIVVLSGANDVFEPQAFAPQIERLLAAAGPDRTVYWVTPHVDRAATSAADRANTRRLRTDLERAAQQHPNLRLVRWGSRLEGLSPSERARLVSDGVHPTPAGAAELARLITTALRTTP